MEEKGLFLLSGFNVDCELSYSSSLLEELYQNFDVHQFIVDYDKQSPGEIFNNLEKEFKLFYEKYSKVYVMGFSAGGVMASYLATQYNLKKLILISPAFKYILKSRFTNEFFSHIQKGLSVEDSNKNFQDKLAEVFKSSEDTAFKLIDKSFTLKTFFTFVRLIELFTKKVSKKSINCPTLILHGSYDEIIPLRSSLYIYERIKTSSKHLVIVPGGYHLMCTGKLQETCDKHIKSFLFNNHVKLKF